MKKTLKIVCAIAVAGGAWCLVELFSRMLLHSRVERLGEKALPKALVENGGTIYCRMKADDFRFPLPPGSRALAPTVTSGGFDWLDGIVEVQFEGSNQITAEEYERWLSGKLQTGGSIIAKPSAGGLSIKFHYFGDTEESFI